MKVIRVLVIGFTLLCQVYGVLIGYIFLGEEISIVNVHGLLNYMLGYPNELPFSHFNPALGYFCFGWGITCCFLDSNYREIIGKFMLFGLIFGIVNLSVGIFNLFGLRVGFGIPTSGIWGVCFGLFLAYTILLLTGYTFGALERHFETLFAPLFALFEALDRVRRRFLRFRVIRLLLQVLAQYRLNRQIAMNQRRNQIRIAKNEESQRRTEIRRVLEQKQIQTMQHIRLETRKR